MARKIVWLAVVMLSLLAGVRAPAAAQSIYGTITGTVTDASGAVKATWLSATRSQRAPRSPGTHAPDSASVPASSTALKRRAPRRRWRRRLGAAIHRRAPITGRAIGCA